jgi:formylglycine-generating enzyme required for sulfatase activity
MSQDLTNTLDISSNSFPNNLTLHRYRRKNQSYTEDLGNDVKLTLMLIPSGEFLMGAPETEPEILDRERQHPVQVSQFLMGRYPVTQEQWRVVAGYKQVARELKSDPSHFKGDKLPVENVSWEDAEEFCQRLSVRTGKNYHLPSEAQWEYACRAGTTTPFHFGEIITTDLANYNGQFTYNNSPKGEYRQRTTEVESFPANAWGLHDMHGNVWEWCADDWHKDYTDAPSDGSPWLKNAKNDQNKLYKLLRGGSWARYPSMCRSASRDYDAGDISFFYFGFRVCCVVPRILLSS